MLDVRFAEDRTQKTGAGTSRAGSIQAAVRGRVRSHTCIESGVCGRVKPSTANPKKDLPNGYTSQGF